MFLIPPIGILGIPLIKDSEILTVLCIFESRTRIYDIILGDDGAKKPSTCLP
jgi:hypothetical protein